MWVKFILLKQSSSWGHISMKPDCSDNGSLSSAQTLRVNDNDPDQCRMTMTVFVVVVVSECMNYRAVVVIFAP